MRIDVATAGLDGSYKYCSSNNLLISAHYLILQYTAAKMKFSAALLALPAVALGALYSSEEYASGDVHQQLMEIKNVSRLCISELRKPVALTRFAIGTLGRGSISRSP